MLKGMTTNLESDKEKEIIIINKWNQKNKKKD